MRALDVSKYPTQSRRVIGLATAVQMLVSFVPCRPVFNESAFEGTANGDGDGDGDGAKDTFFFTSFLLALLLNPSVIG
jgi:hypothetical protein